MNKPLYLSPPETRPNPDHLTAEEVGWIVDRIRAKVEAIQVAEKERIQAKTRETDNDDGDRSKRPFRPQRPRLPDPENWQSHFSICDGLKNDAVDLDGLPHELQPTTIFTIAEEIRGDRPMHISQPRPNRREYLYQKNVAMEVRATVLELMRKGRPPANSRNWHAEKERPRKSKVYVLESIVEFLKEHELGTFERYIDENGWLAEYCPEDTMEWIHHIFQQIRVQKGFKDPAYLTIVFESRLRSGRKITLPQIMARAESYRTTKPASFRPAINTECHPITSLGAKLYGQIRDDFIRSEDTLKDWPTLSQIRKTHHIRVTVATLRRRAKELAGSEADTDIRTLSTVGGHKTNRYSPELTRRLVEEAEQKGWIKD